MDDATEKKASEVLAFFRMAFVAEEAQFVPNDEAKELLEGATIAVIRLKGYEADGRGTFYVARVLPKNGNG